MTDPAATLLSAEAEAALARERLSGTVTQLQERLDPQLLVREAQAVGTAAGRAAVEGARRNPGAVTGAIAAIGLLLARHRIIGFWRHRKASRPVPAQPRKD
ncbi:DUF3618 domain-containing protein [Sphingomonas rubra]|uniref:DUF3618 domain-containing protein n=1 Tax=Sphingomonas rubra TaxID=634430 RepID=A0A1I5RYQ3_9SPHN|nr:DUF3618 domain-containing protein [Sphingomonas rubra]SFP63645.1 Protein of unknown function [Sphingomonas rubra]